MNGQRYVSAVLLLCCFPGSLPAAQEPVTVKLRWEKKISGLKNALLSANGKYVVCVTPNSVGAFGADSGKEAWTYRCSARYPVVMLRPESNEVYVFDFLEKQRAVVLSLSDGMAIRRFKFPDGVYAGDSLLDASGVFYFVDRKRRRIGRFQTLGKSQVQIVYDYDKQKAGLPDLRFPRLRILGVEAEKLLLTVSGVPVAIGANDGTMRVIKSDTLRPDQMLYRAGKEVMTISTSHLVAVKSDGTVRQLSKIVGPDVNGGFADIEAGYIIYARDTAEGQPSFIRVATLDGQHVRDSRWHSSEVRSLQSDDSRKIFITHNHNHIGIWDIGIISKARPDID